MPVRPDGPFADRLVFLHGFTQTHHHWHSAAFALSEQIGTNPALAFVDLPGHGLSRHDTSPISQGATAVAALGGSGTYVGYSMGGRFALLAALARPDLVERLVVIGATAGLDDPADRATRRSLDDERADRILSVGVERFLDEWLSAPMFAGLPADADALEHRRRNIASGLAGSLRSAGTGSQPAIWSRLQEIEAPALVLAGEFDSKFVDIGQRIAAAMPRAAFVEVPHCGHSAHIEAPAATVDIIGDWLAST